ncbi:hypothetical protein [Leucobacter sp. VD1]|uniref:hypothetical protein n=1 Tax=Leucobacter sp. VD1 TaxID=3080381 RepID=UPI003016BDEF
MTDEKTRALIAEARDRADHMTLLAKLTENGPGAVVAREEADRMTRFADALEALTVPDGDAREKLIDVLVMTDLSDYAGTDMGMIHAAADAILAALPALSRAAAPESGREDLSTEITAKREMTSPVYVLRGGAYLLDEYAGVLIDSAGNYSAKTRGDRRALAVLLKSIAEDIEEDTEPLPVGGETE